VLGLFGAVSVATGHSHWQKRPAQVLPITVPLTRALEDLPPAARKKLARAANPALFVLGCAIVVGPDLSVEMRLRAEARQTRGRPEMVFKRQDNQGNARPSSPDAPDLVTVPGGLRGVGE
jgi:hypothetical protein